MSVKDNISDYVTFPRTFENYRPYKPIIVLILTLVMMFILDGLLLVLGYLIGGIDFLKLSFVGDVKGLTSVIPIIFSDLILVMVIPALYLASKIVKDRPFSSYSSSRGGWNLKLYLKALIIPAILYVIYQFIDFAINGSTGTPQVSILFLIAIFITIPLQCIAEEYVFRGFLLQTLGAWFKIPLLAVVLQAVIFALAHGYNIFGFLETLTMGFICGFFAWKTNGIEISSAIHTANNFSIGLFIMLGLNTSTGNQQLFTVLPTIVFEIILLVIIYYAGKKTDWFGEISESS